MCCSFGYFELLAINFSLKSQFKSPRMVMLQLLLLWETHRVYNIIHHILIFFKSISYSLPGFHFHIFFTYHERSRDSGTSSVLTDSFSVGPGGFLHRNIGHTTPQWRGDISCCHIFCHLVRSEELAAAHLISESQLGISPCNEGISHAAVSGVVTQVLIVITLPLHSQSSKGWGAHILLWSQINERFVHWEVQSLNLIQCAMCLTDSDRARESRHPPWVPALGQLQL